MKTKIISMAVTLFAGMAILMSCQKNKSVTLDDTGHHTVSASSSDAPPAKLYAEVMDGLIRMNAVLLPDYIPAEPPVFTGYARIEYYKVSGIDEIHAVYIWKNNLNNGFGEALTSCTKAWHSGGGGEDAGCYGSGGECDLELRNGEVVVICCDEVIVA